MDAAPLRRDRMAASIARRGFARVTDLARELGVSEVTVRTDLAALETEGRITRVHGGAMPRGLVAERESSLEQSRTRLTRAKRAIAAETATRVRSGESILLDVGSTTLAVAHALVDRVDLDEVVIVTNGLAIALALEPAIPRFTVVVTGGTVRSLQHSLVNPLATTLLDDVRVDLAILGATGIDAAAGVTNVNLPEAEVKRRMVASAARRVLAADSSKIGQVHLGRVATLGELDELITDDAATDAELAPLRAAGLAVTTVAVSRVQ
ncbi:DeoR/GlpR family DNA-binding transcription regulator [Microcella humidisoli]|uniref:DeoR/GlpR family DNA-binding transcription regulator n=1 Tax=Microcella humidisoli TaxID=2963406 RepID=A0ABY5FZ72_9MICO|nr:DeoR/GlpR family DNA-binding transcription regulator [Microcella humidisoli]UTT63155.1 DeoR/GlpR family DNA-binding transcription regulator [Microcella humidisoli]